MALKLPLPLPSRTIIHIFFFLVLATLTLAQDDPDFIFGGRTYSSPYYCPTNVEIIYSPFKAWFHFYRTEDNPLEFNRQRCWTLAICLLEQADEARKQQFAATALVMGLIPLTLKDIAWPERRLIAISKRQPILVEILVRALGLVPYEVQNTTAAALASQSSIIVRWAWTLRKRYVVFIVALCGLAAGASMFFIGLVEIYSKRSSLGCVFPVTVLVWYVIALVPAGMHTWMSRMRFGFEKRREEHKKEKAGKEAAEEGGVLQAQPAEEPSTRDKFKGAIMTLAAQKEEMEKTASAVQGANEWWVVQLCWAIYYIAGTLVFTSIMAVTVVELAVWVVVSAAATGACKFLALFLVLAFEKEFKW